MIPSLTCISVVNLTQTRFSITNNFDCTAAFKIRSSNKNLVKIKPAMGVLREYATRQITVALQPDEAAKKIRSGKGNKRHALIEFHSLASQPLNDLVTPCDVPLV